MTEDKQRWISRFPFLRWLAPPGRQASMPGMEFALILIETLEQRRAQLVGRATILAAADSAILLAYLQFVVVGKDLSVSVLVGIAGLVLGAIALYQGLRTIAGVSRRDGTRSGGRLRNHLLNYQVTAALRPADLSERLEAMRDDDLFDEVSQQAVSLSRLLIRRYGALKRSFWLSVWAVGLLALAIGANYFDALVSVANEFLSSVIPSMSPSGIP